MIKFGTGGNPNDFYDKKYKASEQMPKYLNEMGLDAYEYSFGHGFNMSMDTASKAGQLFKENSLAVSIHAPFYINFANPSEEMYEKTRGYIYTSVRFIKAFGGDRVVFHPASCGKLSREEVVKPTNERFRETFDKMEEDGLLDGIYLCPETMGKSMQIGNYKEVVDLCILNSHLIPTFDFGHINMLFFFIENI